MATVDIAPTETAQQSKFSWWLILPWAAMAIALFPFVRDHFLILWQRPHYQFFPILFIGIGLLAVRAVRQGDVEQGSRTLASVFLLASWLLLVMALMLGSRWMAMLTALIGFQAGLYAHGGWPFVKRFLPVTLVCFGLLPLPLGFDDLLLQRMQRFTTKVTSPILDSLGVLHVAAGNVIQVEGRQLLVAEACSGIHSLVTTIGTVLFFGLWWKRPIWHIILLLATALGWVLAGNILRVTLVAYAFDAHGIDLSEGAIHETLGIVIFIVVLGLVASTDAFISFCVFSEVPATEFPEAAPVEAVPPEPTTALTLPQWPARCAWFAVCGFGMLALVQLMAGGAGIVGWQDPRMYAQLNTIDEEFLPKVWHTFTERTYALSQGPGVNLGDTGHIWNYKLGSKKASLSLAYPYADWHELTDCYVAQGWHVSTRQHLAGNVVRCEMAQGLDRHGLLLFVTGDGHGNVSVPEYPGIVGKIRGRSVAWQVAAKRISDSVLGIEIPSVARWQMQLFVESPEPLTTEEKTVAQQVLADAIERISHRLSYADGGSP